MLFMGEKALTPWQTGTLERRGACEDHWGQQSTFTACLHTTNSLESLAPTVVYGSNFSRCY